MVAMYRPSLASLFVVVASILSVTSAPVASEGALQKRTSGQVRTQLYYWNSKNS